MYVDSYCERTAPGLWNEPANAVSNLAFLVAAGLLIQLMGAGRRHAPRSVWLLPVLLGVVGVCSLSFHTFATTATAALDTLSILAFILTAVVVLVHWMWRVRWRLAWAVAPAYPVAAIGVNAALFAAGGSFGGYVPALLGLVGFGVAIRSTARGAAGRAGCCCWPVRSSRPRSRCGPLTVPCAALFSAVPTSFGTASTQWCCAWWGSRSSAAGRPLRRCRDRRSRPGRR
ncbi:ceramidase domain-containing protein [Dactylosporangium cerinum]